MSVVLTVGGARGSGKSALSRLLANALRADVTLHSDAFERF